MHACQPIESNVTTYSLRNGDGGAPRRVAYIMSRFPKLTETFVLYELLAVEDAGVDVQVYPLQREHTAVMHPEAKDVVQRAHYTPFLSWTIVMAHMHYLVRKPTCYVRTLATLLWANLGSARYFFGAIVFFPKAVYLAQRMEQDGIDHIHAHFASHPAAVAFVVRRLAGIPYSFTAHGSDLHRDQHMLREKVAEANFVATISEHNAQIIRDVCQGMDVSHVHVVRCGVDVSVFKPLSKADDHHQSCPASIAIFCLGTLHEVKGQIYLLQAVQKLRDRQIQCRLNFIGDGPDLEKLRSAAHESRLQNVTTFHGRKSRQQVANLLRGADIVAAPSVPTADGRKEGIPVALMEAMASGAAVVASRISGIPELVEDGVNGLLVTPRNIEELAAALERLATDDQLRSMLAGNARQTIAEEFNLGSGAQQLVKLFFGCKDSSAKARPSDPVATREMSPC